MDPLGYICSALLTELEAVSEYRKSSVSGELKELMFFTHRSLIKLQVEKEPTQSPPGAGKPLSPTKLLSSRACLRPPRLHLGAQADS